MVFWEAAPLSSTLQHCVDAICHFQLKCSKSQYHGPSGMGGSMNAYLAVLQCGIVCHWLPEWMRALVQIVKMCKLCRIILCEAAKVKFQSVALHDDATLRIDKWWGGPGPTRHNEKCTIWEDCALHVLRIYALHNRAALCAIRAAQCQHLSQIMRMHNGSEVDNVSSVLGLKCLRPAMILNSNTPSPHVDWYLTPTDGFQPPLILKPSSPNNLNNTLIQPQFYTKYQNGWYLNL